MSTSIRDDEIAAFKAALGYTDAQIAKLSYTDLKKLYVAGGGGSGGNFYPPDDPALHPLHANGDEFEAAPLNVAWTKRNIAESETTVAGATVKVSPGVQLTLDAAGDGIFKASPVSDNIEVVATLSGPGVYGGMVGPYLLDASGNGYGCCWYNNGNGFYLVSVAAYNYSAVVTSNTTVVPSVLPLYYLAMKREGANLTARVSTDGTNWTTLSAGGATGTITQVGILRAILWNGSNTVVVRRFNIYTSPNYYT